MDIDLACKIYEESIYIYKEDSNKCNCDNSINVPDNTNYYLVCNQCGQCNDTVDEIIISHQNKHNYKYYNIRKYKRTSYLRYKLNEIVRSRKLVVPLIHINKLKKLKKKNIGTITKYMKKHKLMKYDHIKTLFKVKNVNPIILDDTEMIRLIHDFNKHEVIYRNNGYKRFNYNFVIMKIFENWKRTDLQEIIKLLQDSKIINKHQLIYDDLFKNGF